MVKKITSVEQTPVQKLAELQATVAFLSSTRQVLVGERDKYLGQMKAQEGEIGRLRATLLEKSKANLKTYESLRSSEEHQRTLAKDHMKTYQRLDKELAANDRRNLAIFLLSVPYVIAIVTFISHHLSVSLH